MTNKQDIDVMINIWESMPKSPDENHITLNENDLEELWYNGFVDTNKISIKQWLNLFKEHKKGNKYVLSRDEFMEKDKYRYTDEIKIPFEPLIINEGKYTDEGLQELFDMSIRPSCSKSAEEVNEFLEKFKKNYREKDNLIKMDLRGKRDIAELINTFPSPTRRRELLFDAMFNEQIAQFAAGNIPVTATPEQAAKLQASTFSTLPSNQSEKALKQLRNIEKRKDAKRAGSSSDEGIELKKVKRSRKGFRS